MEISFADETVESICGQAKRATKALGAESAKKLQRRIAELFNAENVSELVAGRPHPLQGARAGTFALDLHGGQRLLFKSTLQTPPTKKDGGIDWASVTKVMTTELGITMISANVKAPQTYASLAEFAPDWIATPGDTVADVLEERGWTQVELAKRTGFTAKHINQLLKGDAPITQDTAAKLEKVLGSTVRFWVGLDSQYREQLARRDELANLAREAGWLKELPLVDMIRFGWIPKVQNKALQVRECLKFFAVSDVAAWRATYSEPVAAYRASPKLKRVGPSVAAWLREGERKAAELRCADYDKAKFEQALAEIRSLTKIAEPTKFLPELTRLCAAAGVAVVIAPAPEGCPVSGATKWLAPNKALIMLSVRGKSDDKLWFTFFHEAGHLLKHGKSLTFLDILGEAGLHPTEEAEADAFARDFLVSAATFATFAAAGMFSTARVQQFAKEQGVSAGIIVGRLQFEGHISFTNLNGLKVKYTWNHDKP